jgi:type I restriction-modification system DNA methylase subunit
MLSRSAEVAEALAKLQTLYTPFAPHAEGSNEAQTEDGFIKPVLHLLGHHTFEVQPSLDAPSNAKRPDYVFYVSETAQLANKGKKLTEDLLASRAYAVGDAKYWDRKLDLSLKGTGDPLTNANPSSQIDFYIRYSGLDWGILTNGRLWRLYHKDSSKHLERYYEVDLPALLEDGDPQRFVYFYAFFSRRAFFPGDLSLEVLRVASDQYAQGVSNTLRVQVFAALRHMAQGFLDYRRNALQPDPPTLKAIYDASLIVLYRLLFILYAEARGLLPVEENLLYRDSYSLEAVKRDVLKGKPLLPGSDTIWSRLRNLFEAINEGSPPLGVTTFNGGLFDEQRHPFIEQHAVGDYHLQKAIDQLARVDDKFVDYRDLAVRHLGTIYEGLLEFQLRPMALPADGWTIELCNDKGERHASGSYYTPDRIVSYMVTETLEPILRRAVAGAVNDAARVQAVLSLNVLDMAMGSGHFLADATEYIARFLVGLGLAPVDAQGEAELPYWRRRVAQACIYGVDLNPLAVDLAKLSLWLITVAKDRPLSFLDHHLRTGNALVGMRLAALTNAAVGFAPKGKKGKAVKPNQLALFSDDGFRQNMSTAVDSMWLIEGSTADTVAEVKEQERLYEDLRRRLVVAYGTLANVLTAQHFGVDVDLYGMEFLASYALGRTLAVPKQMQGAIDGVAALAAWHHFFHWELEFPEVFFDRHGQPLGDRAGFDAVLGNPPYIRQEALAPFKPFFAQAFPETYHGVADLYVYFYQQGLEMTGPGGRMSYIVTNKWLRSGYGEPLRGYFAQQGALVRIIDFGHAPIFEGADVFPCILVLERPAVGVMEEGTTERQVRVTAFPRDAYSPAANLARYVADHSHQVPLRRLGKAAWSLENTAVDALLEKIGAVGVPLAEFAGVKPYRGVLTGLNEAFLIDSATRDRLIQQHPGCAEIIKPYLRGQDIKRWQPDWHDLWMIVLASSENRSWPWSAAVNIDVAEQVFSAAYPSLHAHFLPFREGLKTRQDKGRFWWELRSCAYYEKFGEPKILYQDITWRGQFTFDAQSRMCNNTVYFLPTGSSWVLAVLNSPLLWSFLWRRAVHGKDEALRLFSDFVETIPIAPPSEASCSATQPAIERLAAIAKADQLARRDLFAWLRTEFDVSSLGQQLEKFAELNEDAFVAEVRKRRPGKAPRLSPVSLRALKDGFNESAIPFQTRRAEAAIHERHIADLVNTAYGLTQEEVALLWETAPPRMPTIARPEGLPMPEAINE